jgi:hypothetical protein
VDSSFRIPGTLGPEIVVRGSVFRSVRVTANGVPVKRSSRRHLIFQIPLADGTTAEMRLVGQWTGMRAVVNGAEIPLERRLTRWEAALTFLPLGLALIGGLVGGLIGGVAFGINAAIARRPTRVPIKVASMLVVTAAAVALVLATAFVVAPIPTLTAGECLNGIGEGVTVTTDVARPVDCAAPHDNEVVGTFTYAGGGSFPGMTALGAYGETPCTDAFRTYVGVAFATSSLSMIEVVPTDLTWAKGDRSISCVVGTAAGSRLTGSVRGTAR